ASETTHAAALRRGGVRPRIASPCRGAVGEGNGGSIRKRATGRARAANARSAPRSRRRPLFSSLMSALPEHALRFLGGGGSGRLAYPDARPDRLAAAGLPVLLPPTPLAAALGVSIPRLRWLAFHTEVAPRVHYVQFAVPKRSGGTRLLSAPHRHLAAA